MQSAQAPIGILNGLPVPSQQTRGVRRVVDFSAQAQHLFDFDLEYSSGNVPGFQSIWVDNKNNANATTIYIQATEQTISIPGNYQGVYPVYATNRSFVRVTSTVAADAETEIIMLTVAQSYGSWPASNSSAVGAATAANQASQISLATTANTRLTEIRDALLAGGGDATAANQTTQIARLDSILTELATIANEATLNSVLTAINTGNVDLAAIETLLSGTLTTKPVMASGGNIQVTTNALGTSWQTFASQAVRQMTLVNNSGTDILFRQDGGGVEIKIADGSAFTVMGITNANQIGVKRVDNSNIQVNVQARWES